MAVTRRAFAGGAVQTTIPAGITGTPATFDIASATGWPSGAPFYVVVENDLSSEEKIVVTRSGTTLTVVTRGVDGTSSTNHAAGATCAVCLTAVDLDEANRLAAIMTTESDIISADASGNPKRIAQGTTGYPLVSSASGPSYAQLTATGIANDTITATQIAADAIGASELADNAVTGASIATEAWTTYTPQVDQGASTNIAKSAGFVAKYRRMGSLVAVILRIAMNGAGTAGSAVTVSLPLTHANITNDPPVGGGAIFDTSAAQTYGGMWVTDALSPSVVRLEVFGSNSDGTGWGATPNAALAAGDKIKAFLEYEVS